MGRSYWFECSKCGYRAKVSGGADRGLHFFVQTIACRDCRQLYDAVTRLRVPDESGVRSLLSNWRQPALMFQSRGPRFPPNFDSVLNRLLYTGTRRFKWSSFKLQCPVSALHPVEIWNAPDKCPRCGFYLEQNALPYRIWE
jgi:hypothetical protein